MCVCVCLFSFLTWVECFGYQMVHGEEDFAKLPDDVRKDLEAQWKDYSQRFSMRAVHRLARKDDSSVVPLTSILFICVQLGAAYSLRRASTHGIGS